MMRAVHRSLTGLLAAGLLLGGTTAHGATRVDTAAFSMQYANGPATGEIHLLSAEPDSVRIALDSLGNDLSGWSASGVMEAIDSDGQLVANAAATWGEYTFAVADGYKVTGFTWSGIVNGGLEAAWYDGRQGIAASHLALTWWADTTPVAGIEYTDWAGASMLSFSSPAGMAFGDAFTLGFGGGSSATAQGLVYTLPDGTEMHAPSIASIGLHDMVLTVHVSAVPEPATYGMLLAGLGVAGWAARRRKG